MKDIWDIFREKDIPYFLQNRNIMKCTEKVDTPTAKAMGFLLPAKCIG